MQLQNDWTSHQTWVKKVSYVIIYLFWIHWNGTLKQSYMTSCFSRVKIWGATEGLLFDELESTGQLGLGSTQTEKWFRKWFHKATQVYELKPINNFWCEQEKENPQETM